MPGVSRLVLVVAVSTCSWASPVSPTSDRQSPFTHHPETNIRHPNLTSNLRIQNGEDDITDKYTYVVAVLLENKYKTCSGTVILPTWVLTSAHCKSPFYVQYGDMTVARENITLVTEILKVIKHPSYRSYQNSPKGTTFNDIGLMFVHEIRLQSFAKLSALDYRTLFGFEVEYAGYGMTHLSGIGTLIDHQKPLQLGRGMIGSCKDVQVLLVFNPKLCVVPQCKTSQSTLPGDSGGPVLVDGKVVGINVGIIYTSMISIFTPLSPFLEWIYKVTSVKPV